MIRRWKRFFYMTVVLTGITCTRTCVKAESALQGPELTIWVDSASEASIRMAICNYEYLKQSYGEISDAFPEIYWNLVDQSHLSADQINQKLHKELEEGKGPDIIYMNEYKVLI